MRNRARARRVKMILMDVDGTLTDGRLSVLSDGEEIKSYNVKDGLGALLAQLEIMAKERAVLGGDLDHGTGGWIHKMAGDLGKGWY